MRRRRHRRWCLHKTAREYGSIPAAARAPPSCKSLYLYLDPGGSLSPVLPGIDVGATAHLMLL